MDEVRVVPGKPSDGCTGLVNDKEGQEPHFRISGHEMNVAVALQRGGCSFDQKLLHAEEAGARLGIVMETSDVALQRMGGSAASNTYIGMPSVLCSTPCQEYLDNVLADTANTVTLQLTMGKDSRLADKWLELVVYPWAEDDDDKALQMEQLLPSFKGDENLEIAQWLRRQSNLLRADPIGVQSDDGVSNSDNWE